MNHQIAGRLDVAEKSYREILLIEPRHAAANHCIGMLCVQLQRPAAGLPHLLAALEENPQSSDYWLGYMEALLSDGRTAEAHDALDLGKQHGLEGRAVEDFAQRLDAKLRQLAAPPAIAPSSGKLDLDRAERRRRSRAARQMEVALFALLKQGNFAEAQLASRDLTERFPERGAGWKTLGALLLADGRPGEALSAMQVAARLMPQDAEMHGNLGAALVRLERFDEAETHLMRAIALDPGFAAAYVPLGDVYQIQGRYDEAEAMMRHSISVSSDDDERDEELRRTSLLFVMSHNPAVDAQRLFDEHRQVGAHLEGRHHSSWPMHPNERDPVRRLKVGMVSGDFIANHPVAGFLEPILASLRAQNTLELHAYYHHVRDDAVTRRLRGYFEHWHSVVALSDSEMAKQVMDDRIDILIDLSGHTGRNRLRVFARKPAPIQVSWLGYPGTTGLQAVDYYLADRHWLPPGRFGHLFTEKLVYLPDRWAFRRHPNAPAVSTLPALKTGRLTFASFHRLVKVNSSTVRLWSQLLLALPETTLTLVGIPSGSGRNKLIEGFAGHGIAAGRLSFHEQCSMDLYLAHHQQVDIGLDTHPYTGGTTTMHSLAMGVPTLTFAGETSTARAGAGILGGVGLDRFVATTTADFVEKGRYWAHHLDSLADLRATLRLRLEQSPGGQPDLIAAHLEVALRHMWRRWCAGLAAESFHSTEVMK
jgi:predicted O-linked N-acetylglucosamine transferase (SPINDLY family)